MPVIDFGSLSSKAAIPPLSLTPNLFDFYIRPEGPVFLYNDILLKMSSFCSGIFFFICLTPGGESLLLDQLSGVGISMISWHIPCS